MKKNRYLLCILASGAMLYYALPRLPIHEGGLGGIFTISWLAFCLIVIAGNLSALLYSPRKLREKSKHSQKSLHKRARQFN